MSVPAGTRGTKGDKMRLVWNPEDCVYEDDEEYYKLKELVLIMAKYVLFSSRGFQDPYCDRNKMQTLIEELEGKDEDGV